MEAIKLDMEQRREAQEILERATQDEDYLLELIYELVLRRGSMNHLELAMLARNQFEGDPDGALYEMEHRVKAVLALRHQHAG